MMIRQGGTTQNGSGNGKKRSSSCKCSCCGRSYAMEWARDRHEKQCREYNRQY